MEPADLRSTNRQDSTGSRRLLGALARVHGSRPMLVEQNETRSYDEVAAIVAARARQIAQSRVEGPVMVAVPSTGEFIYTVFALLEAGAIPVLLNPALSKRERDAVQSDCRAVWAVEATGPRTALRRLDEPTAPDVLLSSSPKDRGSSDTLDLADRDDAHIVFCTSGSTGRMKGVVHTLGALLYNSRDVAAVIGVGPDDRYLNTVPLFHSFGFVFGILTAVLTGASLVSPENVGALGVMNQVERQSVTLLVCASALLRQLALRASSEPHDLSCLRRVVIGGAALPPTVAEAALSQICPCVHNFYGTTELGGISVNPPGDPTERLRTVGKAIPSVQMRIVDNQRAPVPNGTLGEIACRTAACFREYLNMPELTRAVKDEDGWFYTGDLGHLDEAGYLTIMGRKDDMINKLGFKVYPAEIDRILSSYPGVADCLVVGLADEGLGQRIRAVVEPIRGVALSRRALREYCAERLVYYKVPDEIFVVEAFPRTPTGKLDRQLVQSSGWTPTVVSR